MIKKPIINTGDPRSVAGHVVSGAIASAIVSGAVNYKKIQCGEIEKSDAVRDTLKKSAQGGIATGAAISAANHIGTGDWFKALSSMSVGIASLYAVELVDSQLKQNAIEEDDLIEGIASEDEEVIDVEANTAENGA